LWTESIHSIIKIADYAAVFEGQASGMSIALAIN
jgi:hypothetical protein